MIKGNSQCNHLPLLAEVDVVCSHCAGINQANSNFCTMCGKAFKQCSFPVLSPVSLRASRTGSPTDDEVALGRRRGDSCNLLLSLTSAGASWRTSPSAQDLAVAFGNVASDPEKADDENSDKCSVVTPVSSVRTPFHAGPRWTQDARRLREVLKLRRQRPPRVLMVTRRHFRKNKYVDIVGEFHLELVQENGAAPVVIPRTTKTVFHLAEYLPMDGLIIAEGNDLSDEIMLKYGCQLPGRLEGEAAAKFASDTEFDVSKDELEFALMRLALAASCPILAFCRGSQMLSALRGGTLIGDIETELGSSISHLRDCADPTYDSFRHPIRVTPGTPLAEWFSESLKDTDELLVNSYHHQGVKKLGENLVEMARAPDGVLEAFYDPTYDVKLGRFVVGLQFHPERMLGDYPGCGAVYKAFGDACWAYKGLQDGRVNDSP
mmetsp:Transcript_9221/g.20472  ORF Transcript_9221/g.20472 Transcript_9221/m.20472 type:complete len:434 (-) Transcript_9221:316-1617(-)